MNDEISLCGNCFCMTHTTEYQQCGKCGKEKTMPKVTDVPKDLEEIFEFYHLNGIGQGGLTSAYAKEALLAWREAYATQARVDENRSMKESVTHGYTLGGEDSCYNHGKFTPQCHACKTAKWGNVFCKKFEAIIDERLVDLKSQLSSAGSKETE